MEFVYIDMMIIVKLFKPLLLFLLCAFTGASPGEPLLPSLTIFAQSLGMHCMAISAGTGVLTLKYNVHEQG